MSGSLYLGMNWLAQPAASFPAQCKSLATVEQPGHLARQLAQQALNGDDVARLGRALARIGPDALAPLQPFRLGIIGNGTLDLLIPALIGTAARYGFALDCVAADYGQTTQEALDPGSRINLARPDAVLMVIDYRGLPLRFAPGSADSHNEAVNAAFGQLDAIRTGLRDNGGAVCIVQTLAPPAEALFGSFDRISPGTARRVIEDLNRAIADSIQGTPDLLLDVAALAETVGLGVWHSPAEWNLAKLAITDACLPIYADHVLRLIAAMRGKSRRCLVLDLDNTVWGGVIGDDGLDGINLAQGDATGEAHLSVQQMALALRGHGVVLAVSSKNTDEIARRPFREHPEMLLREEHIAVFQANWSDKATNIRAIADALSLGLESLVFLDDNPAERALVRRELPQVAVPELPEDPAWFATTLAAAGYFEAVRFLDEDRARADMYSSNARRMALQSSATDMDSYFESMEMEITFAPFDSVGRARISQLINKSNQFNLTTRRYSEADVAAVQADPEAFTLQVRLSDKFGDNGMISVVICRQDEGGDWRVDTWLMSCRVLGRRVEAMVLREILTHAQSAGASHIIGEYFPTERNALVVDHYEKLGFRLLTRQDGGASRWEIPVTANIASAPMAIRRLASPAQAS